MLLFLQSRRQGSEYKINSTKRNIYFYSIHRTENKNSISHVKMIVLTLTKGIRAIGGDFMFEIPVKTNYYLEIRV